MGGEQGGDPGLDEGLSLRAQPACEACVSMHTCTYAHTHAHGRGVSHLRSWGVTSTPPVQDAACVSEDVAMAGTMLSPGISRTNRPFLDGCPGRGSLKGIGSRGHGG